MVDALATIVHPTSTSGVNVRMDFWKDPGGGIESCFSCVVHSNVLRFFETGFCSLINVHEGRLQYSSRTDLRTRQIGNSGKSVGLVEDHANHFCPDFWTQSLAIDVAVFHEVSSEVLLDMACAIKEPSISPSDAHRQSQIEELMYRSPSIMPKGDRRKRNTKVSRICHEVILARWTWGERLH